MSIPKEFHSFENEGPFTHCLDCGRSLLEDDCEYVIEKAVRNYPGYTAKDVIFDYAMCMNCAMDVQKGMSVESQEKIQEYFQSKVDPEKMNQSTDDYSASISKCMISDKPADECTEYQIFAFCLGDQVHPAMKPYMISDDILDEIQELLSPETRDEFNKFYQKHFPTSPYVNEPDPRLILI